MYLAASPTQLSEDMLSVVKKMLKVYNLDINLQDAEGNTCLHIAVQNNNKSVFKEILAATTTTRLNLNLKNKSEQTVLWLALLEFESESGGGGGGGDEDVEASFPSQLIAKGSDINATDASTGDSLLHACARRALERAALFLVRGKQHQAKINLLNDESESVLHVACENGLGALVSALLERGADPNVQTSKTSGAHTPMHKAMLNNHESILNLFIDFKGLLYLHINTQFDIELTQLINYLPSFS